VEHNPTLSTKPSGGRKLRAHPEAALERAGRDEAGGPRVHPPRLVGAAGSLGEIPLCDSDNRERIPNVSVVGQQSR